MRQLKDTIQLNLLQQSEYLRRFSLVFCSRVQEEDTLNKTGILRHVKEIITKLRTVSDKMSRVLEYHQALGLVPLQELDQRSVKRQQSYDQVKQLLPLRHVYSSLFTTGLHLQNSLIKLRHIEGLFETLEKSKDKETVANFVPNEKQLLEWLQGFQDIQSELNTCITCLDGGVEEMEFMARPGSRASGGSSSRSAEEPDPRSAGSERVIKQDSVTTVKIDETDEIDHMDQVFEAFIAHDFSAEQPGFDDDFVPQQDSRQSRRVVKELKTVLSERRRDTEERETRALSRQINVAEEHSTDDDSSRLTGHLSLPRSLVTTKILGLSQETDSDAESIRSDTNTVRSPDSDHETTHELSDHHRGETRSLCSVNSSRTLSESSDSNRSDVEVSINISLNCLNILNQVDKSRKVYNRTTMSASYSQVLVYEASHHYNLFAQTPPRVHHKHKKRIVGLRSVSTPDIKSLTQTESSSPYVSLELLDHDEHNSDSGDDPDSSDVDSDDGDDSHRVNPGCNGVLPVNKDDIHSSNSSSSDSSQDCSKFRKPKSIKRPPLSRKMSSKLKECLLKPSDDNDDDPSSSYKNQASSYNTSTYIQKHKETMLLHNHQPVGFDRGYVKYNFYIGI